jgi:hypothetical protein
MGQRERSGPVPVKSEFKYENHIDCEMNEDQHVVKPSNWPPFQVGRLGELPSMALQCVLCNCHLVVYEKHATGELKGVKVLLPEQQPKVEATKR